MPTLSLSVSLNGVGLNISQTVARPGDGGIPHGPITLPVGRAGTLSTRTDNDTGVLTVASGHGITTSDKVDVYWSGGMRFGVTVTATTATTISIDAGSGDNLPVATTAIVVTKQVQINTFIDGDSLAVLAVQARYASQASTAVGHLDFQDASSASVNEIDIAANVPKVWDVTGGSDNPFTGNPITKVLVSNGSSSEVATLTILGTQDSTPGG